MSRLARALRPPALAVFCSLATLFTLPAAAETLVRIDDYDLDEIRSTGFQLPRKARIEVEAVGVRSRWASEFTAYAWILDATTREVVWSQEEERSERVRDSRSLRRSRDELELEPGRYELYDDWSHLVRGDWDDERSGRELRSAVRDCWVELRSEDISKRELETFEPTGEIAGAVYRAAPLRNHQFIQTELVLDRPMSLRVYAVCEYPRGFDAPADGGWIVDAASRERVWDLARRDTRKGGGAEKNRVHDDEVRLAAGRYVLCYGTDDSHSWEEWNANPPEDPMNWGITLLPGKDFDAAAFHVNEELSRGEPLLAATKVRDNDWIEQPFRLARDGEIQVRSLGEWDGREFADRAWIGKPGSSDIVWEMRHRDTEHAGGAVKNRMFDGVLELPAGDYVAHYESDDSHSYRSWNADQPYEPEAWGLTIWAGRGLEAGDFFVLEQKPREQLPNVLVQLDEIGDDARVREEFTLDKPTRVRIYALGEGVGGDMYDFGWIERKDTGQVVWEMTYRATRPAGGARKNRLFDGEILLDAGTYVVRYETDDSHSFPDWNDRRPRDPHRWGIAISRAEPE
jgi:hypothetical protein